MPQSYNLIEFIQRVGVASRRDYVFSNIGNPIAASTQLSTSISLDPKLPWVMFGFRIGSLSTTTGGQSVFPQDFNIQLQDAEQRFLFSDPVLAISLGTGDFGFDPYTINPMRIFPPGGAIYLTANNLRANANVQFDILFMGYEVAGYGPLGEKLS